MDWKGAGYIISIVSVLFLGAAAWPKSGDPDWIQPVLIAGMATSIAGMIFRYIAHFKEKKELAKVKAEARQP